MIQDDDYTDEIMEMLKDSVRSTTQADIDTYARPFTVAIGHDYRTEEEMGADGSLEGYIGICLGLYFYRESFSRLEELERITDVFQIQRQSLNPGMTNPLIYVPKKGGYIWGIESDWVKLDDLDDRTRKLAHEWETRAAKGVDPFLDSVLAEVKAIYD